MALLLLVMGLRACDLDTGALASEASPQNFQIQQKIYVPPPVFYSPHSAFGSGSASGYGQQQHSNVPDHARWAPDAGFWIPLDSGSWSQDPGCPALQSKFQILDCRLHGISHFEFQILEILELFVSQVRFMVPCFECWMVVSTCWPLHFRNQC